MVRWFWGGAKVFVFGARAVVPPERPQAPLQLNHRPSSNLQLRTKADLPPSWPPPGSPACGACAQSLGRTRKQGGGRHWHPFPSTLSTTTTPGAVDNSTCPKPQYHITFIPLLRHPRLQSGDVRAQDSQVSGCCGSHALRAFGHRTQAAFLLGRRIQGDLQVGIGCLGRGWEGCWVGMEGWSSGEVICDG